MDLRMPPFRMAIEASDGRGVARVSGPLDVGAVQTMQGALCGVVRGGITDLVIDVAEVSVGHPSALGILFCVVDQLRTEPARVRLVNVPAAAMAALDGVRTPPVVLALA